MIRSFQDLLKWLPGVVQTFWNKWTDVRSDLPAASAVRVDELEIAVTQTKADAVVGALGGAAYYAELNTDQNEAETLQDIRTVTRQHAIDHLP